MHLHDTLAVCERERSMVTSHHNSTLVLRRSHLLLTHDHVDPHPYQPQKPLQASLFRTLFYVIYNIKQASYPSQSVQVAFQKNVEND